MRISHTRVENCGRISLGTYCLHLHLVGHCTDCAFEGNAIVNGVNKGITVHGTHESLVDNNVLYRIKGASIYIEDGNELNNVISNNVCACPDYNECLLKGVPEHSDSDFNEQSAIYSLSPT